MQTGSLGFRIVSGVARPDPAVVDRFRGLSSSNLADAMGRFRFMDPAIQARTGLPVCGVAVTVNTRPGDNLMVHKALDIAQPGDVVVVDTSDSALTAVLGDLVCTKARHRGVAGFIVDGLIRDLPAIRALGDFPVFARGVTPIGPLHRGPGEVNYPISCGGIVVRPGDIIVGDLNGVVVVPQDLAQDILHRLRLRAQAEVDYKEAVARGEFSNAWVDTLLESAGVQIDQADEQSNQGEPPPD